MNKNRIYFSLIILLLLLTITGGQVFQTEASPIKKEASTNLIDEGVWQEIQASPTRKTTFLVGLKPDGEESIEAQFRLEKMLVLMQEAGSLEGYQAYYGRNIIKISGGASVLHFLEDWPELESVSAYTPGGDWEKRSLGVFDLDDFIGTSQITGQVTADGGITNLSGIEVTAYLQTSVIDWHKYPSVYTGADGSYTISGLASGIYRVKFEDPSGDHVTEYFNNKSSFELATNFEVLEGETVANITADLALAGKISGTIDLVAGGTESGLVASAWSNTGGSWQLISNDITNGSGEYTIGSLAPGNYRVGFSDSSQYYPPRYLTEYFDNELDIEAAQDVAVTAGITTTNIDAGLGSYGSVSGNVKAYDGTTNLANIVVDVYQYDTTYLTWEYFSSETTDSSGNYKVFGFGTENVRLGFFDQYDQFASEYYNDQSDLASADNVAVNLGEETLNINAQLSLATDTVDIDLVGGWNLVSLPLLLGDSSTSAAFSSISGSHSDIFSYEANLVQPWKFYNPPIDEIITVNSSRGYWINMTAADTLSLTGTHPLETTIDLYEGWNLIGYPSVIVKPVESVLAEISGLYTLVWQYKADDQADPWKSFNPTVPSSLNDLTNMAPGYGYWIYMTQDATLNVEGR